MSSKRPYLIANFALATIAGTIAVGVSPVMAADLGGNCCADLEERIAELEATTARKGNRKVSLTISGWVNEAAFWWDDGSERNVYVGTNSLEQSRFKFAGKAKIDEEWAAGYTIEIGVQGGQSSSFSQDNDNGSPSAQNTLNLRKSSWFIESKHLGKISVGLDGTATYHLLDDADGVNTRNYADAEAAAVALGAFDLRVNGVDQNVQWGQILGGFNNNTPGQSGRRNVVRYDSPTFAGFLVTAAWGEDDMWDAALVYKGEVGDFAVQGRVGYGESTDNTNTGSCTSIAGRRDCQWWGAAATVQHKPTGVYVYGGFGEQNDDNVAANAEDTNTTWFIQGGIEQKFIPLGKTVVFGEFRNDEAGTPEATRVVNGLAVRESDVDHWAAGVVQSIDAAAMDLYVIYRHADGDVTSFTNAKTDLDAFDVVITGARIQF